MWEREILPGLTGRQPSKIKSECASEESFLGDALSERDRDRIRKKALSREALAIRLRHRYPLEKNGHGRKKGFWEPEKTNANTFERYQLFKLTG
jgi:hypothetical protein